MPNGGSVRIVSDTNIVLSGLLWRGTPRQLIDLARSGQFTPCTSLVLLAELAEVMLRAAFVDRIAEADLSPRGVRTKLPAAVRGVRSVAARNACVSRPR